MYVLKQKMASPLAKGQEDSQSLHSENIEEAYDEAIKEEPEEESVNDRSVGEILEVAIDLGQGCEDFIRVCRGDDIQELVEKFCAKHNLKAALKPKLVEQIEANLCEPPTHSVHVPRSSNEKSPVSSANITDEENSIEEPYTNKYILKPISQIGTFAGRMHGESNLMQRTPERHKRILPGKNYGVTLYDKGMKLKEEQEKLRRKEMELRDKNEIMEATFKPVINKTPTPVKKGKIVERLTQHGVETEMKKEKTRGENMVLTSMQLTFSPNVNKKSAVLAKSHLKNISFSYNVPTGISKFAFLFEDAKKRQEYQNNISQLQADPDCTFKPDIDLSQRKVRSRSPIGIYRCYPQNYYLPKNSLVEQRPDFKPKIGRPPKTQRNPQQKPIGEYLQDLAKRLAATHVRKQREEKEKLENLQKGQKLQEESERLAEKRRLEAYKQVFTLLDSDADGVISSHKIDITRIPAKVLELYTPLLCEMEELNQSLTLPDFLVAANKLYHTLTLPEREVMLKINVKKRDKGEPETSFTFKPGISKKSQELAEKSRAHVKKIQDLPSRLAFSRKLEEIRIQEQQREREAAEVAACTFRPYLPEKSRNSKGRIGGSVSQF